MLLSMTGYGKAEAQLSDRKVVVEIRSLNSKSMDLSVRIPQRLRVHELEMRALMAQRLERGKVDLVVYYEEGSHQETATFTPINEAAFDYYYHQLSALVEKHSFGEADLLSAIMRMPGVVGVQQEETQVNDEEWKLVQQLLEQAIESFLSFRKQEGAALQTMFEEKLSGIESLLAEVEPWEKGRVQKIRERLETNLAQLSAETQQQVDRNRLEQEMIYYLEKLDITEEKVRLTNHIRYFRETMEATGAGVGKKLGFVAQEMGREINTLGSKSNQSEMQVIVVKMKDILEQIKEQVLNVL